MVITTKELSPCGDTAKELTAGTVFLGSRKAPSPWDPKTTRTWLGGWLLSTLNLCPWVPPWEAGGGLGEPWCHQSPLAAHIWRHRRSLQPCGGSIKCAPPTRGGSQASGTPRGRHGERFVAGAPSSPPGRSCAVGGPMESWHRGPHQALLYGVGVGAAPPAPPASLPAVGKRNPPRPRCAGPGRSRWSALCL